MAPKRTTCRGSRKRHQQQGASPAAEGCRRIYRRRGHALGRWPRRAARKRRHGAQSGPPGAAVSYLQAAIRPIKSPNTRARFRAGLGAWCDHSGLLAACPETFVIYRTGAASAAAPGSGNPWLPDQPSAALAARPDGRSADAFRSTLGQPRKPSAAPPAALSRPQRLCRPPGGLLGPGGPLKAAQKASLQGRE